MQSHSCPMQQKYVAAADSASTPRVAHASLNDFETGARPPVRHCSCSSRLSQEQPADASPCCTAGPDWRCGACSGRMSYFVCTSSVIPQTVPAACRIGHHDPHGHRDSQSAVRCHEATAHACCRPLLDSRAEFCWRRDQVLPAAQHITMSQCHMPSTQSAIAVSSEPPQPCRLHFLLQHRPEDHVRPALQSSCAERTTVAMLVGEPGAGVPPDRHLRLAAGPAAIHR